MTAFYNRSEEKPFRKRLRGQMPSAEVILWSKLRRRQLLVKKFRRQFGVGTYCLDFYCPEIRLAIELDGDSHFSADAKTYDAQREQWIQSFQIRFLRFTNTDIYENLDGVLHVIATAIENTPLDPPFERGEGKPASSSDGEGEG